MGCGGGGGGRGPPGRMRWESKACCGGCTRCAGSKSVGQMTTATTPSCPVTHEHEHSCLRSTASTALRPRIAPVCSSETRMSFLRQATVMAFRTLWGHKGGEGKKGCTGVGTEGAWSMRPVKPMSGH